MTSIFEHDLAALSDRLRDASAVTPELIANFINLGRRRLPSNGQSASTARIERLIDAAAWTDVALALIDLELPLWRVRRIAYDAGEWYCELSRQRELPGCLDQSIEDRHTDLALAILCAFIGAQQQISAPASRSSVPAVPPQRNSLFVPLCCDNFV